MKLGLYVITGVDELHGRGHLEVAAAALEGGADALQLREKHAGGKELLHLARALKGLRDEKSPGCLILVNDRLDVALAAGVEGCHLGQEDLPVEEARRVAGEDLIIGVSVSSLQEAVQAERKGADYLGVGPVFPTPTKPDAGEPIGLETIRRIKERIKLPLVAIGGVNADNLEEVFRAGADGVAVISAVLAAEDMYKAVRELREAVDACLRKEY